MKQTLVTVLIFLCLVINPVNCREETLQKFSGDCKALLTEFDKMKDYSIENRSVSGVFSFVAKKTNVKGAGETIYIAVAKNYSRENDYFNNISVKENLTKEQEALMLDARKLLVSFIKSEEKNCLYQEKSALSGLSIWEEYTFKKTGNDAGFIEITKEKTMI